MRNLARILAPAMLLLAPLAARADGDPPTVPSAAEAAAQPRSTPLSELDVVAKPKATPLSELEVVAIPKPPTLLSGVEVKPPPTCLQPRSPVDQEAPTPKLVSTYPADGQTVQPGYAVLRLTFDLPMACRGSLPQNLLTACMSDELEVWHESLDRRSLLILCDLKPGVRYELGINRRIPVHFQGLSGREPDDGGFGFNTSDGAPVTTAEGLVGRDPQLAAMLMAAEANAVRSAANSATRPDATKVSIVKVQETNRCLQPRDPPDPEVPAPKLVSTFPAQGQTVRPGLLEVRFTFDLPMACVGGVTVKGVVVDPCSDGIMAQTRTQHWSQPWDRHSMRFRCQVKPGKRYVVSINESLPGRSFQWPNFQGLGGKAARPFELTFTTSQDAPVLTQEEADAEDPQMARLLEGHEAD